ncbi:MAG: sensor histidine kinase [Acidobacteriota bacterium]
MAENSNDVPRAEERNDDTPQGFDVYERVREKKDTYRRYNFERSQEEAFATFFDLAQEYTSIDVLYQISVAVPKEFLGLESNLYVIDSKSSRLQMVCSSRDGLIPPKMRVNYPELSLSDEPYCTDSTCVFPIRGNRALTNLLTYLRGSRVLGLFEISPMADIDEKKRFFLEKFTNRIGYNLHQKMLVEQNLNHIKFINQLVSDIEHNVISPNLYYKLFLIRMKKSLDAQLKAQQRLQDVILFLQNKNEPLSKELCDIHGMIDENLHSQEDELMGLSKHYEHTSLFLETLFRRDHFEKGTYVLRKQTCNFRTEIIQPLLERYIPQFEKKGITVDNRLANVPDEQVTLFVDKGLISQVFDNLFSNAVKYTRQVEDQLGNKIKLVSYNRQILRNFMDEGIHGVRFNFFTTGEPLSEEDARRIFDEGYRASTSGRERGTGHGLHFVRNVVEIHGGQVGCEPQRYGNTIFFILPVKAVPETSESTD